MQRTESCVIKITGAANEWPGTWALIITALSLCPDSAEAFCEQSTQPEAALPCVGSAVLALEVPHVETPHRITSSFPL